MTAALAGIVAGLALPLLWSRFGGPASDGGVGFVVGLLLLVALPAHAFVVGFGRDRSADSRQLDTALMKRGGAWIAAAAVASVLASAWQG